MKIGDLSRCLTGKLKFRERDAPRHRDYRIVCSDQVVPLPALLRVSHGPGELANRNLGGVAKALGMNEASVKDMIGCHIGRPCVLLCVAIRLLVFVLQRRNDEGEVFRHGLEAMLKSILIILKEPDFTTPPKWSRQEQRTLERVQSIVDKLIDDDDCGEVAQLVKSYIAKS